MSTERFFRELSVMATDNHSNVQVAVLTQGHVSGSAFPYSN